MLTNIASATPTSCTPRGGCTDFNGNQLLFVESNLNTLRQYNLSTGAQNGSNINLTSTPAACSMIASGIAVVGYSSTTSIDLVTLTTGSKITLSGGSALPTVVKGQLMDADYTNSTAIAVSATAREFTVINYTTATATSIINTGIESGATFLCVILKAPGRYILGSSSSQIVEVDINGFVWNSMDMGNLKVSGILGLSTLTTNPIEYLTYDNNLLLVSQANGALTLIDWSTQTILYNLPGGSNTQGITLGTSASGIVISSRNQSAGTVGITNQCIYETDFTISGPGGPIHCALPLFTDQAANIIATGINPTNGLCWALQSTPRLRFFQTIPRASTTRTISLPTNVKGDLILLDDTGGVGNSFVILDTHFQSPGVYRVPTGRSIKEFVKEGNGATSSWDKSSYLT